MTAPVQSPHTPVARLAVSAIVAVAAGLLAGPAFAGAITSDRFIAGAAVTESAPLRGDLFAAGGTVDVDANVAGDAFLAGGKVRLGADVGQSLVAAAGQLTLLGAIARNARLAAGNLEIADTSRIGGNLSVAAGSAVVRGTIDGQLRAASRDVLIDAAIAGDVEIAARSVELGPHARIGGKLRYRSAVPLQRNASAQVLGGVERLGADVAAPSRQESGRGFRIGVAIFWTTGVMLLAAIVVAAMPRVSALVSETLRLRPGLSVVLGFVVLVCTPVAVLLLFATIIGIPLGLLLMLAYLLLLPLAWVGSAIGLGDWVLARSAGANAARSGWRIMAALLAVIALAVVSRVPWLGGVIAFAVALAGLGAWTLQLRRLTSR